MKKFADKHHRELEFGVGDEMFFKLRPYRQKTLAQRRCAKLAPRYYGPYRVLERIGAVAYRLGLPTDAMIHNVFHISQLKKCVDWQAKVQTQPPNLLDGFELQMSPDLVLGVRWNNEMYKEE